MMFTRRYARSVPNQTSRSSNAHAGYRHDACDGARLWRMMIAPQMLANMATRQNAALAIGKAHPKRGWGNRQRSYRTAKRDCRMLISP
jgi:hypothetical protein